MAGGPQLTFITLTDRQSYVTAATFATLQQNIVNYTSQFLPLVGGTLTGAVTWSAQQNFPSSQVAVGNPNYPHSGYWRSVQDHINDASVHSIPGPPQIHALTHELSGTDPLYGNKISISTFYPGIDIKTYVDSSVAAATASFLTGNYAPSSYYQIGGSSPIYGNLTAISSASGSTSIKSYVDNSLATALSGPIPQNPAFTTIAMSGSASQIAWTGANINLISQGNTVFSSPDGNSLAIQAPNSSGFIEFGNPLNSSAYGIIGVNGYSIGSTAIGPTSASIAGTLSTSGDLELTRSSSGLPTSAGITFGGSSTNAVLTWNADVVNGFYLSKQTTISGSLTLSSGNTIYIASGLAIGNDLNTGLHPGIYSDGTNININPLNGGQVGIGYNSTNITGVVFGPTGNWGSLNAGGLTLGTSVYSASGAAVAGTVKINGGYTSVNGDLGLARSNNSAWISFGQGSSAAYFEYGVNSNGYFTFGTIANGIISQIKNDGTYVTGSTSLAPTALSVNGTITAQKAIYAQAGITFNGASGFVFTGNTAANTGLFSNGGTDLRLYTGGVQALAFQNAGNSAIFSGNASINNLLTTQALTVSGAAIIGSSLTIQGTLYAGTSTITKFRVKDYIDLGYYSGTANTSNIYKNVVVVAYTGGQIEAIRMSAVTADTTGTQSGFTIYKNGAVIGTISLPNGGTTAQAYPITNPTPITAGDQLQAVLTSAGTATGVSAVLEISQFLI